MHGAEYDEMCEAVNEYADKFESVAIAEPLLGEVGADATEINADKEAVATAITTELLPPLVMMTPPLLPPMALLLCSWATALPTPQRSATARCR